MPSMQSGINHVHDYLVNFSSVGNNVTKFEVNDNVFDRLFVFPGAAIQASVHLRPMVSIDSTHLKGQLLLLVSRDANNHIILLAFATVDKEYVRNWSWFFDCVLGCAPWLQNHTVISDRAGSIISAMSTNWADAQHVYCTWHIAQNMTRNRSVVFNKAARACNEAEFDRFYAALSAVSPSVVNYLESGDLPRNKWTFYASTGVDSVTLHPIL